MRLGQHFLTDEGVAERQVNYAALTDDDTVLEIGPGTGVLTKKIAARAPVIAVEYDERFIPALRRIENVRVIHADILDADLAALAFTKVVANIPFEISSPLTFKLLDRPFSLGIIMYQQEFARRMVARPKTKDYSRLSVMTHFRADCAILETVPKSVFCPQPKVDSCIVRLVPVDRRFAVDEDAFDWVVRAAFTHRRKTLKNALFLAGIAPAEVAENLPWSGRRGEELTPAQLARVAACVARLR
jgi:16S rRNA (adenine1518-N6/adenine1519-N6)-dimethyltransferase